MKRTTERKLFGFMRVGLVALIVILQLALIFLLVRYLRSNSLYVYLVLEGFSIVQILLLVGKDNDPSFTIAWVLIISMLPGFGFLLYAFWGRSSVKGKRPDSIRAAIKRSRPHLPGNEEVFDKLARIRPKHKRTATYLKEHGFPLYENTSCRYFPLGELQFDALLEEIKQARSFVFLSTFILNTGVIWSELRDALIERARAGVDVRIMFDDLGSIFTAPDRLEADMKEHGIQIIRFNPVHKFISRLSFNYRNHQKITVIDGNIAYTGGANIADEYANLIVRFGHWKDTAIRLEGEAVFSLCLTFLELWEAETGEKQDYDAFRPTVKSEGSGFFQPYSDGPTNNPKNPAETMYRQMIANADRYVYFSTPYFVVPHDMMKVICAAAESGVDVRIIVPKKWDRWYVGLVSRSNYQRILEAGGKIYEYTPGFIHAKTMLSDDDQAITGSINMDFRSFHMHFENGVWISGSEVISEIAEDFQKTIAESELVTLATHESRPFYQKMLERVFRVFAVLM